MNDPKNTVIIHGGVVADPELINDNILKLRLAVDYAGQEKGSSNNSGYFDVTYYLNNESSGKNADFVRNQVKDNKMKKGSQIVLSGRLVQERWESDGKKGARVVIVAEALTYAGGSRPASDTSSEGSSSGAPAQSSLPSDF